MHALFVVPCLVSNNVNEKLVPALTKIIERNIILTNIGVFERAVKLKYSSKPIRGGIGHTLISKFPFKKKMFESNETIDDIPVFYLSENKIDKEMENRLINEVFGGGLNASNIDQFEEYYEKAKEFDEIIKLTAEQIKQTQDKLDDQSNSLEKSLNKATSDPENKVLLKSIDVESIKYNELVHKLSELQKEFVFIKSKKIDNELKIAQLKKTPQEIKKLEAELKKIKSEFGISEKIKKTFEIFIPNFESKKQKLDIQNLKIELQNKKAKLKYLSLPVSADIDIDYKHAQKSSFQDIEKIEIPTEIHFFSTISIEPTYIEIPISWPKYSSSGEVEYNRMLVKIGVKCVAYYLDDTIGVLNLLAESKNMGIVERLFKKAIRKFNIKKLWGIERKIHSGELVIPDEAANTIKYAPSPKELNNPTKIAKLMSESSSSPWTTTVVLSTFDFSKTDRINLSSIISNYKKMTKYVVGSLVIVNETKESVYFCTVRLGHCQEIQFEYLKKIMNLSNIIDYSVVSRKISPFRRENKEISHNRKTLIQEKINDILTS